MQKKLLNLKEEDNRKLNIFENDCFKFMLGVSWINHIKMNCIRSDLEIPKQITDIIKKKDWNVLVMKYTKAMSVNSYKKNFTNRSRE